MRLMRFWRRNRRDAELRDELEAHLAHEADARVRDGLAADAARSAAARKLGNTTRIRETVYESSSLGWIETLARDLRYAARVLRRSPGFALAAILSLALGIGANTAIFELLNALRLRSLPVANPSELAEIRVLGGNRGMGISSGPHSDMTGPLYDAFVREQDAFSGVFAWSAGYFHVGNGADRHSVKGLVVTGTLFPVLGVTPFRGRLLTPDDDRRGCAAGAVVLSHAYWARQYGMRDTAVGAPMVIDDQTFHVAGVAPPQFFGLEVGKQFDVAIPACAQTLWQKDAFDQRNSWWLVTGGRLKPGWTLERAAARVGAQSGGLFAETAPVGYDPSTLKRWRALVLTAVPGGQGVSQWRDDYEQSLWLLLAITGLVLLIACTNLASLMLARASVREREFALRTAIGASRARLLSQALSESVLVATIGAALGGALAGALSRALVQFVSTEGNELVLDTSVDWRVLGFTAGVATLTCLVCGFVPALRSSRTDPTVALKAGGRSLTSTAGFSFQRVLVVAQVAVSLVLIVGALLFVRSFRNVAGVDSGMSVDGLYIAIAGFDRPNVTPEQVQQIRQGLLEHVQGIPGVRAAATTTLIPLVGMSWTLGIKIATAHGETGGQSKFTWISPTYFDTVGMPLLRGRGFDARDTATSHGVMVVNETFVRQYLNPATAIGTVVRTVAEPQYPALDREVVGIVRDAKYGGLKDDVPASAFVPVTQHPAPQPWTFLAIRSSAAVATLTPALIRAYEDAGVRGDVVVWPMAGQIRDSMIRDRLMSWLSGFFGVLAALLSAIGLYGVMAYAAARRSNEIAIRMALGAGRGDVLRMMLGQASRLVLIGVAIGVAIALALGQSIQALLFGIVPHDVTTIALAALALLAIGLTAAYVPTARAARISPLQGLRAE
jgi:predicted permease